MADNVVVTTATSGATVAAEDIGGTEFQRVKLIAGSVGVSVPIDATSGVPAASSVGLVVNPKPGASVSAVVSGTVSVSSMPAVSGTVTVQVSGAAQVSGTISVSAMPAVSGTVSVAAVSTLVTILSTVLVSGSIALSGTGLVSVVPGVSVGLGSLATVVATTTATSGVTGVVVWLGASQSVLIGGQSVTVQQGISVSAVVSGTVTVLTGGGLPGSTTGSSGMSGVVVWLGASQTILISTQISGSVSLSGTGLVSVVPGVSVSLGQLANAVVTTTATSGVSGPIVWLGVGQTIATVGTVSTILGTQVVSVVPGLSVLASITASATLGTVVTILGTQIVTLATGGSVAYLDVGRTNVLLIVTSTTIGISGTMLLFTVYTGLSQVTAGVSLYVVPAGKTFRVLSANLLVENSVLTSPVVHRLFVCASTAAISWTSTTPVMAAVGQVATSAGVAQSACNVQIADIAAAATVGIAHTINTSGGTIDQAVVAGYLFP